MSRWSEERLVVDVAAAFGLPLPTLVTLAVAALAGPLDLGRGPLEAGPDLVGLQLGDRALVALRGLPGASTMCRNVDFAGLTPRRGRTRVASIRYQ
jgi:hypothetical protein